MGIGFQVDGPQSSPRLQPTSDDLGATFVIGRARDVIADRSGRLFAFAKDRKGFYGNNWATVTLAIDRHQV